jgi:ribosomal protein S18 acetylase RimI-like enzyme
MRGSGSGPTLGGSERIPITVRAGGPPDAGAAATLHAQLISEGFLSSLGPRFLRRLYSRIARAEGSFLLIAEIDHVTVGFIAGSVALRRLYRTFLLRDGLASSLSAPVRLLTALPRVLETLRHGGGDVGSGGAELLAVAVDPGWRDRHVGRQLVESFLIELERRGVSSAQVVVGADNASAIAMYRRAGFAPVETFELHRGVRSMLMETVVARRAGSNAPLDL